MRHAGDVSVRDEYMAEDVHAGGWFAEGGGRSAAGSFDGVRSVWESCEGFPERCEVRGLSYEGNAGGSSAGALIRCDKLEA